MPLKQTLISFIKPHSNSKNKSRSDEELVKAAAWAWYHRSCSQRKLSVREFDITTPKHRGYRPSRYKVEAMRIAVEDNQSLILDGYEKKRDNDCLMKKTNKSGRRTMMRGFVCGSRKDVVDSQLE